MFRNQKAEQLCELELDSLIESMLLTTSGGHPSSNGEAEPIEARRQALLKRLKAQVAVETAHKD